MTQLRDIEDAMRRADSPVLSAPDIAERVDQSSEWTRQRLELLEREGAVGRRDVGARATAWWHVDRVSDPIVPPAEHPDQSGLAESVEQRDDQEASGRDRDDDERITVCEECSAVVAGLTSHCHDCGSECIRQEVPSDPDPV